MIYLAELFRSFRPLHNPIGFGIGDFILFAATLAGALAIVMRATLRPYLEAISKRPFAAMSLLAALSILLRLALLPPSPAPLPAGADDFGYLLLADTLRHLHLANPTHPLHQFFEAVFVLQQPAYSSIYPAGQGIALALGRTLFGSFWAGVLLSTAAFVSLCYWMLRGWLSPNWALVGGLLALIQFGPLNQWTNSYWGGALSGCAGCLVFGALPRLNVLRESSPGRQRLRNLALLGLGLDLQLLTRPFEFVLLSLSVAIYCIFHLRTLVRAVPPLKGSVVLLVALTPAIALTLCQNRSVTGSWTTLPYMLSRYEYGVPTTFTFQPNPVPHRSLTPEQALDYQAQAAVHGSAPESIRAYSARFVYRLRYGRFFLLAPLYFALFAFLPSLREWHWWYVPVTVAVFLFGTNFYPYFFPHYIAAVACLVLLLAIKGLENVGRIQVGGANSGALAAEAIVLVCAMQFFFWYGIHLSGKEELLPAARFETWDFIDYGDPQGRYAIASALRQSTGKQLVFVRYSPRHRFSEWIGNQANIDGAKTVWALDLGPEEDKSLLKYFPNRQAWLLEPDAQPPRLSPYSLTSSPFESVHE